MKTQDLTGPALDWAVAKAEGTLPVHNTIVAFRPFEPDMDEDEHFLCTADDDAHAREQCENAYPGCEIIGVFKCVVGKYSSRWDMAGPIIERERIEFKYTGTAMEFVAWLNGGLSTKHDCYGPTPLIAAMRCYVASRLGDEVEIPEELK
jgi:hypothetical protein